jgi:aldehyde:ferredoxin oxidoreductase
MVAAISHNALGQLQIAGFTLHGAAADWLVIHFKKNGEIVFDDASPYLGHGNYAVANMLYAKYGKKVALALCGPVGEQQGLLAGIAFSDKEGRPARLAARGGVGAVMGNKKIKAVVVDLDKVPALHDAKKVAGSVKEYAKMLMADSIVVEFYNKVGTMGMADVQNMMGGLPCEQLQRRAVGRCQGRRGISHGRRFHRRAEQRAAAASRPTPACPAA